MKNFKTPFLSALVFFGTLLVLSVGYAAWTSLVLSDADGGKPLTSALLKGIMTSVNDIGTRTDGIYSLGGNVGIGTASPSLGAGEGLHVKSNVQPNAKIILEQGGISGGMNFSNNSNGLYFNSAREIGFWPQNVITMTLTGGNVGIGTTSPQSKLQISGNYIQIPTISGSAPLATDCNEASEAGRMIIYTPNPAAPATSYIYICPQGGGWVVK